MPELFARIVSASTTCNPVRRESASVEATIQVHRRFMEWSRVKLLLSECSCYSLTPQCVQRERSWGAREIHARVAYGSALCISFGLSAKGVDRRL